LRNGFADDVSHRRVHTAHPFLPGHPRGKRKDVQSVKARARRLGAAVAEVGGQDHLQRTTSVA